MGEAQWKQCCRCRKRKSLSEFPPGNGSYQRYNYCRTCHTTYERERQARRTRQGYLEGREYQLNRNYGISCVEYELLLSHQNYMCAICSKLPKTRDLAVDHDHKKGPHRHAVRGLICTACNKALGMFDDNPEFLTNAINYLTTPPAHAVLRPLPPPCRPNRKVGPKPGTPSKRKGRKFPKKSGGPPPFISRTERLLKVIRSKRPKKPTNHPL